MLATARLARRVILFAVMAIAVGPEAGAWSPRVREDRAPDSKFESLGCERTAVDHQDVGDVYGYLCRWKRPGADQGSTVLREERFWLDGQPFLSAEIGMNGSERLWLARLEFSEAGDAFCRVSQRLSRDTGDFFLELLERGKVVSRYESNWDRFFVDDFVVTGLPSDYRLKEGRPLEVVESFFEDRDLRKLAAFKDQIGKKTELEFGFHFGEPGSHPGWDALREHGCVWLSEEERQKIDPHPEHCLMEVVLTPETLKRLRRDSLSFALKHGGRYYDWSWP